MQTIWFIIHWSTLQQLSAWNCFWKFDCGSQVNSDVATKKNHSKQESKWGGEYTQSVFRSFLKDLALKQRHCSAKLWDRQTHLNSVPFYLFYGPLTSLLCFCNPHSHDIPHSPPQCPTYTWAMPRALKYFLPPPTSKSYCCSAVLWGDHSGIKQFPTKVGRVGDDYGPDSIRACLQRTTL